MRTAWVLGDQLSHDNPALEGADRVLLVESEAKLRSLRFHRQKVHLVLSSMRRFGDELQDRGFDVDRRRARSLATGVRAHIREHHPESVALLEPTALGAGTALAAVSPRVEVIEDGLFLTSPAEFAAWAEGRKQLRMEDFYRRQRRRFELLIDGDEPEGGRWNFDAENREPPPDEVSAPRPYRPREDAVDEQVRRELDAGGIETAGSDGPRLFPGSRAEALRALESFVTGRLPHFGPLQDAMVDGEPFMWHSLISSSLNLGLLSPLECALAAENAYRSGAVPIASAEGFIRQVIGWREYVWGVYRLRGPSLRRANALRARVSLPAALERLDPEATEMRCLSDALGGLAETAYSHHIRRLMIFGNLLLLLGVRPGEANDWFHRAFIDGFDWVMAPNVIGMALWADGGQMMSKPYAASGRYVDRMSDHCGRCRYDPKQRTGEDACPFTTLYWDFLDRNRKRLAANHRMKLQVRNLDRIDAAELGQIRKQARTLTRSFEA